MPCRPSPEEVEADHRRALELATRVACNALTALDKLKTGQNFTLSEETVRWWEAHKQADEERLFAASTEAVDEIRKICDKNSLSFPELLQGINMLILDRKKAYENR